MKPANRIYVGSEKAAQEQVAHYYDANVSGKLRDFVEGNDRVECAWQTIERWAPENLKSVLEIGCGAGAIAWRMSRLWPQSNVVGADISPHSLEVAEKLFTSQNLRFRRWPFPEGTSEEIFDLIVLMDVYEHVAEKDRLTLHQTLKKLRSPCGRIVLSFPTPRHLKYLREHSPEQIQPVDEDVDITTVSKLADDIGARVIFYQQVGVWHEADYAHAVLGNWEGWVKAQADSRSLQLVTAADTLIPNRPERLRRVHEKLGPESYPDPSDNSEIDYSAYINPACAVHSLDTFVSRSSIFKSLSSHLSEFSGTLLDIGCGHMPYKKTLLSPPSRVQKYIGLDLADNVYRRADLEWDGKDIPLNPGSIDCAVATEVFEHCPDPISVMQEIFRVLSPGGLLFFTVPFLWPLHDVPHDEYRYTPFALTRLLREAGFNDIKIQALGGWDASMAQLIGLWVRRRPMSNTKRELLSKLALPFVKILLKRDRLPNAFESNCMMTGLSGTARKSNV
jgi:2-polyprenyl-3-methyl-5-hydroxy-6-metoxy-1,4-benzoquinol methylase